MNSLGKVLVTMALFAVTAPLFSQSVGNDTDKTKFHYGFAQSSLDTTLMNNTISVSRLKNFFDKVKSSPSVSVKSVEIISFASMEGDVISNRRYVEGRNATAKMLVQSIGNVPDSLITCINGGMAWKDLRDSVARSDMPYKEEVLYILDNQPEETWRGGTLVDSRNKHLMDLHSGQPYRYMSARFFPYFRYSKIRIIYSGDFDESVVEEDKGQSASPDGIVGENGLYLEILKDTDTEQEDVPDTLEKEPELEAELGVTVDGASAESDIVCAPASEQVIKSRFPDLGIKTNVALLVSGVSNAGVEVGISDHFSFDFPVIYSPYTIKNNYKLRLLAFQPELRYWLKGFSDGHFFGLTGNFAWFNVALDNDNRYQDTANRPLMGVGISYGYSWRILPALSLEFTVGAGYANIHYDVFYNVENGIRYTSGVKNYWGLTKAGISVVYVFNAKERGR